MDRALVGVLLLGVILAGGGCGRGGSTGFERTVRTPEGASVLFSESLHAPGASMIRVEVRVVSGGEIAVAIIRKQDFDGGGRSPPVAERIGVRSAHLTHRGDPGFYEVLVTPVNPDLAHRVEVRVEIEPAG